MPSTVGFAKSGSELEPHGTADKKSGSKVAPQSKEKQKISPGLIFFAFS
jgi:hypothetical protein